MTRLPVGRRASGFVLVAQCVVIGPKAATNGAEWGLLQAPKMRLTAALAKRITEGVEGCLRATENRPGQRFVQASMPEDRPWSRTQ